MFNTSKKVQILAPSGSAEQLVAAVNNGCDAVYLGLDNFNARMKAPNFTLDNLCEWVDYCHLFGVKTYVAINTSLKNDEFVKAVELLLSVYALNVDGVIVTDPALMRIAGNLPKPFDVVASTQLNVHDKCGAEFVKEHGATTVVCARECSLDDIREIASTGIDVECFIHGAMCVSQSGQCLFSSMVGGNSGNRGLCAQPCRKRYFINGTNNGGYLLSARDMCGLNDMRSLVDAGATTLKIEGRNRRAEYAGMASRIYKRLLDNDFVPDEGDYAKLAEMFNRSMSDNGYLKGKNSDIIYSAVQNHTGVLVGYVKNGAIETALNLSKGDGLKVFDCDKEICGGVVLENGTGRVRAQFGGKVTDGMRVHRTTNVALNGDVLSVERKLNVKLSFTAKSGQKPIIAAVCDGIEAVVVGDFVVERALNSPVNQEEIAKQLQKSGNTHYTINDIVIKIDEIFIAKSQINGLRRRVLEILSQKIIDEYNKRFSLRKTVDYSAAKHVNALTSIEDNFDKRDSVASLVTVCYCEEELIKATEQCDHLIYRPALIDFKSCEIANKYGAYVDLPSFADLNYVVELLKEVPFKVVCNNVGQINLARKFGVDYIAGCGLNIFNDYMLNELIDGQIFIYSRELSIKEIREFTNKNGFVFVDGYIPLMQLVHCPYKVAFNCDCTECKANINLTYRDEMNNKFVIKRRRVGKCLFELINGNKLSVVNKLKSCGRYVIDYDAAVLQHYVNLNNGKIDGYSELQPYTKGRLYDKIN